MSGAKDVSERKPLLHLYIDETGSRHPDKATAAAKHGFDWFGLGGLLIREEDETTAKTKLASFISRCLRFDRLFIWTRAG
jgi:hypothetical protein